MRRRAHLPLLLAPLLPLGCASIDVRPTSPNAGSFRAEARAFHLFAWKVPYAASARALEVVADRGLLHTRIDSAEAYPRLFPPLSWINWFLGFEGAIVHGRYGDPP